MYVYRGRLDWLNHAENETLTIIFPGTFDLQQPVYAIWQWTTDTKGGAKTPCLCEGVINRVSETTDANKRTIRFHEAQYYTFDGHVSLPDQNTLTVTMHKEHGKIKSRAIVLHLSYSSPDPASCRIYIGKLNYAKNAVDETMLVLVPNALEVDQPVCIYWQWTKDSWGARKREEDYRGVIDVAKKTGMGMELQFFFRNDTYYKFIGEVDSMGEAMTLKMLHGPKTPIGYVTLTWRNKEAFREWVCELLLRGFERAWLYAY
jgi:hypothetical protein